MHLIYRGTVIVKTECKVKTGTSLLSQHAVICVVHRHERLNVVVCLIELAEDGQQVVGNALVTDDLTNSDMAHRVLAVE